MIHLRASRFGGHVLGQACGFSLVELLIALAICALLSAAVAGIVVPSREAFEQTPAALDLQQRGGGVEPDRRPLLGEFGCEGREQQVLQRLRRHRERSMTADREKTAGQGADEGRCRDGDQIIPGEKPGQRRPDVGARPLRLLPFRQPVLRGPLIEILRERGVAFPASFNHIQQPPAVCDRQPSEQHHAQDGVEGGREPGLHQAGEAATGKLEFEAEAAGRFGRISGPKLFQQGQRGLVVTHEDRRDGVARIGSGAGEQPPAQMIVLLDEGDRMPMRAEPQGGRQPGRTSPKNECCGRHRYESQLRSQTPVATASLEGVDRLMRGPKTR